MFKLSRDTKKVLLLADDISRLNPMGDTTLPILKEMLNRNWQVDYCTIERQAVELGNSEYLNTLPTQKVIDCKAGQIKDFLTLENLKRSEAKNYNLILHRKDPPMDQKFIAMLKHFSSLNNQIKQINNPLSMLNNKEHEFPLRYPKESVPTYKCNNISELYNCIKKLAKECVVKPHDSAAGFGIKKYPSNISQETLESYYTQQSFPLIVQPFIENIQQLGDVRILTMNGKIVGSILRRAPKGAWISNLRQGGTAEDHTPTPLQLKTTMKIADELKDEGLLLLGFDFIGDQLSELNFTSPTGLVQMNAFTKRANEKTIVDELAKF